MNGARRVPLIDLAAQHRAVAAEVASAIERVAGSQRFVLGPEVEALEEEIAELSGVAYGVGVSSGTDALLAALAALDVGPGDEVVTTPFTFFSTAGSIARLGARPVFVDIEPASFNLDPARLEAAIGERTRAIVPVHLYGRVAAMDEIASVARRHGVSVVEDAAQAIGAEHRGRPPGALGDLACLSFFPTKNLGAWGDGGMVLTGDAEIAARLRRLRNHGFVRKYHAVEVGGNFRLDALQAAILRAKLPHLERWNERRRSHAARYRMGLAAAGAPVEPPADPVDGVHAYHQFVIRTPRRDELQRALADAGVGSEIYYPRPLHLQDCFRHLGYREGEFPQSERAAAEALALPIHPDLTPDDIAYVVETITAALA